MSKYDWLYIFTFTMAFHLVTYEHMYSIFMYVKCFATRDDNICYFASRDDDIFCYFASSPMTELYMIRPVNFRCLGASRSYAA